MVNYWASDIYSHGVFYHISVPYHFCRLPRVWGNCSGLAQIILWLKVRASMSLFPFPLSNNLRKTPMKCKTSNIKLFLTPAGLSKPIFQESTGCRRRVTVIFFPAVSPQGKQTFQEGLWANIANTTYSLLP